MPTDTRATTVRLPHDLADRLALVAEIDGEPLSVIFPRLAERYVAERTADPAFQGRMAARVAALVPGKPVCCAEFARTGSAHTEACCFVNDGADP